jgi:hypothetical protein
MAKESVRAPASAKKGSLSGGAGGAGSKGASKPPPATQAAADRPKVQPPALPVKTLATRLGIPVLILWILAGLAHNRWVTIVVGLLTVAALGLVWWVWNFASKTKRVANLVGGANTKEERQEAIEKIDKEFKKGDAAATFAKAQLLMHEDPRHALEVLESIDLAKVVPAVADEARAQRAMIHLLLGETQPARKLVDPIDMQRHPDTKAKATLAAVVAEAWSRTGQAKKAIELLGMFDMADPALADLKPGILRAQVFAFGAVDDLKQARSCMHQLAKIDPRIVAGFAAKGVHPLLVKEARKILERAGALPRIQARNPQRG